MEPNTINQMLEGAGEGFPNSTFPPAPHPSYFEPWKAMALGNALEQYPPISPLHLEAHHGNSFGASTVGNGMVTRPQLVVEIPQPMHLQVPTPAVFKNQTPGIRRTSYIDFLDLKRIRKFPLSTQQELIQNPKVTKLDLRDQIALHEILLDSLIAAYRSKAESFGMGFFAGPEAFRYKKGTSTSSNDDEEFGIGGNAGEYTGEETLVSEGAYNENILPREIRQVRRTPRFQCNIEGCDRSFSRKADRDRHENSLHSSAGPARSRAKRYVCLEDGCRRDQHKPFNRKDNLKSHIMAKHSVNGGDAEGLIGEICDAQGERAIDMSEDETKVMRQTHMDSNRRPVVLTGMPTGAEVFDGRPSPHYGNIKIGYYSPGGNIGTIAADRRGSIAQSSVSSFGDAQVERVRPEVLYGNNVAPLAPVPPAMRLPFSHQVRRGPEGFQAGIEHGSGQIFQC
ncbi:hypothetical protein TWF281_002407 [Arthrobotrys megalospora]